jgi:hypothetical protein
VALLKTKDTRILDDVREGFALVATQAQFVRIRTEKLAGYAAGLKPLPEDKTFDASHHYQGDAEQTAAFVLTLDSINFGSGYKDDMAAEGWEVLEDSIYFSLSTRLKRRFESEGPYSADSLARMRGEDCAALLELPYDAPISRAFADLCSRNLNELGNHVRLNHEGSFLAMVNHAGGRVDDFIAEMARLDAFADMPLYRGLRIPILKRAQSTAGDLNDAFAKLGLEAFHDIERLTILADNDVPHVLRTDGLLEYEGELAGRIDQGMPIESGSQEEIEIRACTGFVAGQLAALSGLTEIAIDRILWHRAAEKDKYKTGRAHRTKTIFY